MLLALLTDPLNPYNRSILKYGTATSVPVICASLNVVFTSNLLLYKLCRLRCFSQFPLNQFFKKNVCCMNMNIQGVPLATGPGISLIILPLMRILQRNLKRTTDTFLFISHTTKVLLFKFHFSIFIGVRIIKEMLGSVASETRCIMHQPNITNFNTLFYLMCIGPCIILITEE